jgi:1-acyl-sn-glycerol-3-phosphate acyltransferase
VCKALANRMLRFLGWRLCGKAPDVRHYVLICAPHTTNWDLLILLLAAQVLEIPVVWAGKSSLFRWPWGVFFRALRGVSIDRSHHADQVSALAARLVEGPPRALAISPEGTRSAAPHWKSGFYYIANRAKVPIVPAFVDFKSRCAGVGEALDSSLDIHEVMEELRRFYADKEGKDPQRVGPIRLRDEA